MMHEYEHSFDTAWTMARASHDDEVSAFVARVYAKREATERGMDTGNVSNTDMPLQHFQPFCYANETSGRGY